MNTQETKKSYRLVSLKKTDTKKGRWTHLSVKLTHITVWSIYIYNLQLIVVNTQQTFNKTMNKYIHWINT